MSLYVTVCHNLKPSVIIASKYRLVLVCICNNLSLSLTICHYLKQSVTICNNLSLLVTVCHYLSLLFIRQNFQTLKKCDRHSDTQTDSVTYRRGMHLLIPYSPLSCQKAQGYPCPNLLTIFFSDCYFIIIYIESSEHAIYRSIIQNCI